MFPQATHFRWTHHMVTGSRTRITWPMSSGKVGGVTGGTSGASRSVMPHPFFVTSLTTETWRVRRALKRVMARRMRLLQCWGLLLVELGSIACAVRILHLVLFDPFCGQVILMEHGVFVQLASIISRGNAPRGSAVPMFREASPSSGWITPRGCSSLCGVASWSI